MAAPSINLPILALLAVAAWGQETPALFPCRHGDAILMNPKTQYFYACYLGDWYPAFMVNLSPLFLVVEGATQPGPKSIEIKRLWRREAFEEALRKYNHRKAAKKEKR